ncbi:MAG: MFS transporter [Armatimonadetes bacterium]|nr:MFS transporter [Armatimonadota bacterium]
MKNVRWYIVTLLLLATTINYLDRQALSIAAPVLREIYNMSNRDYGTIVSAFLLSYAIMQPVAGRIIDWLGTRRGFSLAVIWWSIANMLHALAGSVFGFAAFRFLLGIGEAGNFPGAIKTVAEWFPSKEKTVATGIFNVGAGAGALIAPPLVAFIILKFGWQAAFLFTGAIGFLWVVLWLAFYHPPEKHPKLLPEELEYIRSGQETDEPEAQRKGVVKEVLSSRSLWSIMVARFISDPVWTFYVFWLPNYLKDVRDFSLVQIGLFAWIPFLAADVGSIAGGALAAFYMKKGLSVIASRKAAMCSAAILMPAAIFAVRADSAMVALLLVSVAAFGHQLWAASLLTLPADLFPKRAAASAYGFTGSAGQFGAMLIMWLVGFVIDRVGYVPVFTVAGFMHPIAAVIMLFGIKTTRQGIKRA